MIPVATGHQLDISSLSLGAVGLGGLTGNNWPAKVPSKPQIFPISVQFSRSREKIDTMSCPHLSNVTPAGIWPREQRTTVTVTGLGAIQVLRNVFFWKFDTHTLVMVITLNCIPS